MNIINSDIITNKYDGLWENPELLSNLVPRPVAVIVNDFLPGSDDEMQLNKMLQACRLDAAKYHIVRLTDAKLLAWHKLNDQLKPKIIFLIGILPVQLGISAYFRLNEVNNFDGCIWLPTLPLSELNRHDEVKKQLWTNGMKPIFVDMKFGSF